MTLRQDKPHTYEQHLIAMLNAPNLEDRMFAKIAMKMDARESNDTGQWVAALRVLQARGAVSTNVMLHIVSGFLENMTEADAASDPELNRLSDACRAIERAHGLDAADDWRIDEGTPEWRSLNEQWEARAAALSVAHLREMGQEDLATMWEREPKEVQAKAADGWYEFIGRDFEALPKGTEPSAEELAAMAALSPEEQLERVAREPGVWQARRAMDFAYRAAARAPEAGPWIIAARALEQRGVITRNAVCYFVAVFIEHYAGTLSESDHELRRLGAEMSAIEETYEPDDDEEFDIGKHSPEWAALARQDDARTVVLTGEILRRLGLSDIADLRDRDMDEFNRLGKLGWSELLGDLKEAAQN